MIRVEVKWLGCLIGMLAFPSLSTSAEVDDLVARLETNLNSASSMCWRLSYDQSTMTFFPAEDMIGSPRDGKVQILAPNMIGSKTDREKNAQRAWYSEQYHMPYFESTSSVSLILTPGGETRLEKRWAQDGTEFGITIVYDGSETRVLNDRTKPSSGEEIERQGSRQPGRSIALWRFIPWSVYHSSAIMPPGDLTLSADRLTITGTGNAGKGKLEFKLSPQDAMVVERRIEGSKSSSVEKYAGMVKVNELPLPRTAIYENYSAPNMLRSLKTVSNIEYEVLSAEVAKGLCVLDFPADTKFEPDSRAASLQR